MTKEDYTTLISAITELSEVCTKYNVSIGGCGCCGSPWICIDEDITRSEDCITLPDDGSLVKRLLKFKEEKE